MNRLTHGPAFALLELHGLFLQDLDWTALEAADPEKRGLLEGLIASGELNEYGSLIFGSMLDRQGIVAMPSLPDEVTALGQVFAVRACWVRSHPMTPPYVVPAPRERRGLVAVALGSNLGVEAAYVAPFDVVPRLAKRHQVDRGYEMRIGLDALEREAAVDDVSSSLRSVQIDVFGGWTPARAGWPNVDWKQPIGAESWPTLPWVPGTGAEPASREEVDDILFADYRTATKPEVAAALVLAARHGIPMYDLPETLYDATARVLDVGFQNYAPAIPEVDLIDKIADWYADEEEEPPEDVVDLVRSALKVLSEHDALNHASAVRWLTDPAGTEVLVVDTVDDGGEHYIDGPFLDAETATKRMREKGYQYPNQVTPEIASEIVGQARAIASSAE